MDEREKIKLYKQVFNTEQGKQVLGLLEKKYCGPSYVMGGELEDTLYREGRRCVVEYIKKQVNKKI